MAVTAFSRNFSTVSNNEPQKGSFRLAINKLHRRWVFNRTLSALSRLSDGQLRDIGFERGNLRAHVTELTR